MNPPQGGTHRRSQGAHQHGCPHHGADFLQRRLFQHQIEHERKADTRAGPLEQPAQKEQRKISRHPVQHRPHEEQQIPSRKEFL